MLAALAGAAANPASARPELAALLDALDSLPAPGALVAATILTDAAALAATDPLEVLTGTPPAPPLPVVLGTALLADFADGARSTGVLAVTVSTPDSATVEALRAHLERGWSERVGNLGRTTFARLTGGPAEVTIHPTGAARWVLRIVQTTPTESFGAGLSRNRSFARLLEGALMRDLAFLQP